MGGRLGREGVCGDGRDDNGLQDWEFLSTSLTHAVLGKKNNLKVFFFLSLLASRPGFHSPTSSALSFS